MIYGDGRSGDAPGAVAWLVGEENRGLAVHVHHDEQRRLMIGVQGVAQAELALQQRPLTRSSAAKAGAPGAVGQGMSLIAEHPGYPPHFDDNAGADRASRAICCACAVAADLGRTEGYADQARHKARAELLTPIAKAFSTDAAVEVASLGVQVHGGMGFIEETGAAQTLRDARIAPIYEGTNGIQAIDLVTRKLSLEGGAIVGDYIAELRAVAERARAENRPDFGRMGARLEAALDDLKPRRPSPGRPWCQPDCRSPCRSDALSAALRSGGRGGLSCQGRACLPGGSGRAFRAPHRGRPLLRGAASAGTAALKAAIVEGAEAVLGVEPAMLSAGG